MTTANDLDVLKKAIQNAKSIKRDGTTFVIEYNNKKAVFPEDLMATLDARLPEAIDFLNIKHSAILGKVVRRSLAHWANPCPPDENFKDYFLSTPASVSYYEDLKSYSIVADRYKEQVVSENCVIAMQTNKRAHHYVSEKWLQTHYPDVIKKMNVLRGLGMDTSSVTQEALKAMDTKVHVVELPDISFD